MGSWWSARLKRTTINEFLKAPALPGLFHLSPDLDCIFYLNKVRRLAGCAAIGQQRHRSMAELASHLCFLPERVAMHPPRSPTTTANRSRIGYSSTAE